MYRFHGFFSIAEMKSQAKGRCWLLSRSLLKSFVTLLSKCWGAGIRLSRSSH
jgi:hypothetical protein